MSIALPPSVDVIVVGAGNAAFCAALAAAEHSGVARVLMLERAPEDEAGGNTRLHRRPDAHRLSAASRTSGPSSPN